MDEIVSSDADAAFTGDDLDETCVPASSADEVIYHGLDGQPTTFGYPLERSASQQAQHHRSRSTSIENISRERPESPHLRPLEDSSGQFVAPLLPGPATQAPAPPTNVDRLVDEGISSSSAPINSPLNPPRSALANSPAVSTSPNASRDGVFRVPSISASQMRASTSTQSILDYILNRLGKKISAQADHVRSQRAEREATPASTTLTGVAAAASLLRSGENLTQSNNSPASPRPGTPEYISPTYLAYGSPSDDPDAQRVRKENPLFQELAGHGVTTYGLIPVDRIIDVDDESSAAFKEARRSGGLRRMCEGSTNGHYLQDRKELQMNAEYIVETDYRENELFQAAMNTVREINNQKNSWARTTVQLQLDAYENTSDWMTETWGGPIRDLRGQRFWLKRERSSFSEDGSPQKRPRLFKPKPPKKEHKRFTEPANEEISNALGGTAMQRSQSPRPGDGASGGKKKLVLLPPKSKQPQDLICSRCGLEGTKGEMHSCLICGRYVYCSGTCQNKRSDGFCSQICVRENRGEMYSDLANSISLPTRPKRRSPSVTVEEVAEDEDGDVDMDDALGMSKAELEEQRRALKEFEHRRSMQEMSRRDQPDVFLITDYRITGKGRVLDYYLHDRANGEDIWVEAVDLHGHRWEEKMHRFWYDDPMNAAARRAFEDPDGDNPTEPPPFGRFILKAEFSAERHIIFDVREFERYNPEDDFTDDSKWMSAVELGDVWDGAIAAY